MEFWNILMAAATQGGGTAPAPPGPTYGPELVTNGDFSSSSGWTLGGAAIISGGKLIGSGVGGETATTTANDTLIASRCYEVVLVIDTLPAGDPPGVSVGGGSSVTFVPSITAAGTWTGRGVSAASVTQDIVVNIGTSAVTIDSVSVREPTGLGAELVTGGDFASGTGWTVAGTGAAISGGTFNATVAVGVRTATRAAGDTLVSGDYFRTVFTVSGWSAGTTGVSVGNLAGTTKTADGTYTLDQTTTAGNQNVAARIGNNGASAIDDFSVKKIL